MKGIEMSNEFDFNSAAKCLRLTIVNRRTIKAGLSARIADNNKVALQFHNEDGLAEANARAVSAANYLYKYVRSLSKNLG
jgi:hypothetical protein